MVRNNKLLSFLLLVSLFALVCIGVFVSLCDNTGENAYAAITLPTLSIESTGVPNSNNQISIKIKLSRVYNEDITANIKAYNWSAVVDHDYTAIGGNGKNTKDIVFKPGTTEASFSVTVKNSKYGVVKNGETYVNTRQFIVKIYNCSENAQISTTNYQVYCNTGYDHQYKLANKTGNAYAFAIYQTYATDVPDHNMGSWGSSASSHSWDWEWKFYDTTQGKEAWDYYEKNGLAHLYFAAKGCFDSSDKFQYDGGCDYKMDGMYIMEMEQDGYFDDEDYYTYKLYDHSYSDHDNIEYGGDTGYPNIDETRRDLTTTQNKDYTKNGYYDFDGEHWFRLYNKPYPSCHYYINGGANRKLSYHKMWIKVSDVRAPSITDWIFDECCEDGNNLIYARIRFNEPVQVSGSAPTLVCNINSFGGSKQAYFNYVGGELTDTLVFALDPMSTDISNHKGLNYDGVITHMYPSYILNQSSICDFSERANKLCNCTITDLFLDNSANMYTNHIEIAKMTEDNTKCIGVCEGSNGFKCQLDPRIPEVQPLTVQSAVKRSFDINVTVANMDKGGTLYYEWSTSKATAPTSLTKLATKKTTGSSLVDGVQFSIPNGELTGIYYLWLKPVSAFGKTPDNAVLGGKYIFDSAPYDIIYRDGYDADGTAIPSDLSFCGNPFSASGTRSINFYIKENYPDCDSGIGNIYLYWSYSSVWNTETEFIGSYMYYDANRNANPRVTIKDRDLKDGEYVYQVTVQTTAEDFGIYFDEIASEQGKELYQYDKFYLGVVVEDKLGNTITVNNSSPISYKYYYDTRPIYESETTVNCNPLFYADDVPVYDFSKSTKPIFETVFDTSPEEVLDILIKKPGEKDPDKTYLSWFNPYEVADDKSRCRLEVREGQDDVAGYYELSYLVKAGTEKYTIDFPFYLTNDESEATTNYSTIMGGRVLTNQVYIVGNTQYYYKDAAGNTITEKYAGEKADAIFSSYEEAFNYIKYMEMQDMYALVIPSESIASQINSGSADFVKAADEKTTAVQGQVWIRYKRVTWEETKANSGWGYYFYANSPNASNSIDLLRVSDNLNKAINEVVEGILTRFGNATYLTNANGYLNQYGTPSCDPAQIHPDKESVSKTLSGTPFTLSLEYGGDPSIYSPNIYYLDSTYILASSTPLQFSKYSKLYVSQYGTTQKSFNRIHEENGIFLKYHVPTTGVYTIREIDEFGAKEYEVFIDVDAPTIMASYMEFNLDDPSKVDEVAVVFDDHSSEYSFSAKSFTIKQMTSESDDLAYVAVYNTAGEILKEVVTYKQLRSKSYTLDNGRYFLDVYDRSGNHYRINLVLNDSSLTCDILESVNIALTFKVYNRNSDDINTYEVKRDGVRIESVFEETKRWTESGIYSFYVEDWYGNVFSAEYEFIRHIPNVTWKYSYNGQNYTYVDPKDRDPLDKSPELMIMRQTGSQEYTVTTSCQTVMFLYDTTEDYSFEFLDEDPPEYAQSSPNLSTQVQVTSVKSWKVKIFYTQYPEIYAIYTFVLDVLSPTVTVTYTMKTYSDREEVAVNTQYKQMMQEATLKYRADLQKKSESELKDFAKREGIVIPEAASKEMMIDRIMAEITVTLPEGTVITADTILYDIKNTTERTIIDGSSFTAEFFNAKFDDVSGIKSVQVYVNGELYTEVFNPSAALTLARPGEYLIVCQDNLSNETRFKFTNTNSRDVEYYVDDKPIELEKNQKDFIKIVDGEETYIKEDYGSVDQIIRIPTNKETFVKYLIKKLDRTTGETETSLLQILVMDGMIIPLQYQVLSIGDVGEEEQCVSLNQLAPIYNVFEAAIKKYELISLSALGVTFQVMADEAEYIYIKLIPGANGGVYTVETKISEDMNLEPVYLKSILSSDKTDIILHYETSGEVITTSQESTININDSFIILENEIPKEVATIEYSYSSTSEFKEYRVIFDGELYTYDTIKDGFYSLKITNVFGNVTTYTILISSKCIVITFVRHADGSEVYYSNDYTQSVYSNGTIGFEVYSDTMDYTIIKDGVDVKPNRIIVDEGYYMFTIVDEGNYLVTIKDEFNNIVVRTCSIKVRQIEMPEGLIYGYNEKALRKSENYTNNRLSVDPTKLGLISYVAVRNTKTGAEKVLIDKISEKTVQNNDELVECIGVDGTGIYTLVLMDAYGNSVKVSVNYREESPLRLSRITRSTGTDTEYSLDLALEIGLWSNSSASFDTEAVKYRLTIDGTESQCPKSIAFMSEVQEATLTYEVYYIDEYGFEYSFSVYLVRQELKLSTIPSVKTVIIDEMPITKNNIILELQDNTTTTYTVSGGETKTYKAGMVLKEDGVYRFIEQDFAGNISTLTIKKDTIAEYVFYRSTGTIENPLAKGTVVNNDAVLLAGRNGDELTVKRIYRDDEPFTETDLTRIALAGKWEFLIADQVGNESYFTFYIINHYLNSFDYTTPYNYKVTAAYYDDHLSTKISYLHMIEQDANTSHFKFTQDGDYFITMQSQISGEIISFEFTIDTSHPKVQLVGCTEGETTLDDITIGGLQAGDTVYIYRDGALVETFEVTATNSSPVLSEPGTYKLVVANPAGNETELNFIRKRVPNGASSALIIIAALAIVVGLFIGLCLRNKSRVDK